MKPRKAAEPVKKKRPQLNWSMLAKDVVAARKILDEMEEEEEDGYL